MDQLHTAKSLPCSDDWRSPDLGPAAAIELPQGRLRYHTLGRGPAILFAHGWLANANLWRKVAPPLASQFTCLVPDLPLGAHLEPMRADFDATPEGIARIMNDFLDALGVEEVTLVGNDSGGAYSQVATALRPERVRRLLLNACETPYDPFPPTAFRALQDAAQSPSELAGLLEALRERTFRRDPAAFGRLIKYPIEDEASDSYVLPLLERADVCRDASRVMSAASQDYVAAAGRTLRAGFPGTVTFIWPTEDVFFSLENVRRYAGELPDAGIELVENSYAFTPEDQPQRFAELVARAMGSSS